MKTAKAYWTVYVFWVLVCEAVGVAAALLTQDGMESFRTAAAKPPLTPPAILFPLVWTILYALMGISTARITLAPESPVKHSGLNLFVIQLVLNFFWSLIFFNAGAYGFSLLWLGILWVVILLMILCYRKINRIAGNLQIPYLLWVTFAGYLNYGVRQLNGR